MSAITGIFYRDGCSVDPKLIERVNNKLSHRGPDGSAVWFEKNVAFGHQMLWTTPESLHETLPFHDKKAGLVITSDARIDNRKELTEELDIEDKEYISDSYFILKSYEKWGEKCPEHLLGDFSFAIWDINEEKIFCARDHMGVKPFYYYLSDNMFVFGTEIKPFFLINEIQKNINETKIADYLISMHEDRELTFYNNIYRLPAAHSLIVNYKDQILRHYWSLDPTRNIHLDSNEEYTRVFRDIFIEAVKCRLRSAFPIGSELSGGLDSSSIVCVAKKILLNDKNNLKTFSVIFEDLSDCDESHFINIISDWCKTDSYYVYGDRINPFEVMDDHSYPNEIPFIDHSGPIFYPIYDIAQKNDVKILLSGFEGDATVGRGYYLLYELVRQLRFKKVIKEIRNTSKLMKMDFHTIFFQEVIIPIIPEHFKQFWRFIKQDNKEEEIFNKDFAKKIDISNRYHILDEYSHKKRRGVRENHFLELNSGFYQSVLENYYQVASKFSMEFRYPFMDKRLLEFCLALPPEQQLSNGWDRIIMRRAMENIVPYEIQWRRDKKFFDANFNNNLFKYGNKKFKTILNENNNLIRKYIDINEFKKIIKKFKSESYKKEEYIGSEKHMIYKIIKLDSWLRKNIF